MWVALAIGIPVFLIFGGALLAFTVSPEFEPDRAEQRVAPSASAPQLLFWAPDAPPALFASPEDVVAHVEAHLLRDADAGQHFANDPSAEALWADPSRVN